MLSIFHANRFTGERTSSDSIYTPLWDRSTFLRLCNLRKLLRIFSYLKYLLGKFLGLIAVRFSNLENFIDTIPLLSTHLAIFMCSFTLIFKHSIISICCIFEGKLSINFNMQSGKRIELHMQIKIKLEKLYCQISSK